MNATMIVKFFMRIQTVSSLMVLIIASVRKYTLEIDSLANVD